MKRKTSLDERRGVSLTPRRSPWLVRERRVQFPSTMNTEDLYLQAIIENPDDDLPRLIYSDWLEERGDPRAEFIRVQCELTKKEEYTLRWRDLTARSTELLKAHKAEWLSPLWGLANHGWFERGFVHRATLMLEQFTNGLLAELFQRAPVREMKFFHSSDTDTNYAEGLAASPFLERFSGLNLEATLEGFDQLRQLLESPHLGELRTLNLSLCQLDVRAVHYLTRCEKLSGLRILDLRHNRVGDDGLEAFVNSTALQHLESLDLAWAPFHETSLTDAGLQFLAQASCLKELRSLSLYYNKAVTDDGIRFLANSSNLGKLQALNLGCLPQVGPASMQALAKSQFVHDLQVIDAECTPIGPTGMSALAQSDRFQKLRRLNLHMSSDGEQQCLGIGDQGAIALAASANLQQLHWLDLSLNSITNTGAAALLESPYLQHVWHLDLKGNSISKTIKSRLRKRFGQGVCSFSRD